MNWRKVREAFTLVELLVVIGIIALLIAILMPALSRARKQALQASCGSNERQIAYGALAYANDWKEQLPSRNTDPNQGLNLRGWPVAALSARARLPVIGFDTTTIWDWGTYAIPGYGYAYGGLLGGWAFVMRDYLKNDFDIWACPDGYYTKDDFMIKWEWAAQGLCGYRGSQPLCTSSIPATGPGLWQWRGGYLWLPHRPKSVEFAASNCGGTVADQDNVGDIPKTASDLPSLLLLSDFVIFTNREFVECPGASSGVNTCGVGANHNASSYRQLPLISSNCAPQVFPPNIGREENPTQMPLGQNHSRIDARTEWIPWQDWRYFKHDFGWGSSDWWHSF